MIGLMAMPYPGSTQETITYNDTQTIYFNEYWYESDYLSAGNTIDYYVQSKQSPISFAIWDKTFENFGTTPNSKIGSYSYDFTVAPNEDYQYVTFYLYQGDTITYDFSVTNNQIIEFFISDGKQLQKWNNYESSQQYNTYFGSVGASGSFTASHSEDWYLVWYNSGTFQSVDISVTGEYSTSSRDMSSASVAFENTEVVNQGTFTVPDSGTWYFFIYFDPSFSPAEYTEISFTIVFNKAINSNDKWKLNSPFLTFLALIIIILLIVAVVQRRNARKYEDQKKTATATSSTTTSTGTAQVVSPSTTSSSTPKPSTYDAPPSNTTPISQTSYSSTKKRCLVCETTYFEGDIYCTSCGTKLIGRDYGVSKTSTPIGSNKCAVCGYNLDPNSKFCRDCGTQVK